MFYRLVIAFLLTFAAAWVQADSIRIQPIEGVSFTMPSHDDLTLEMLDRELYLFSDKRLVGVVTRNAVTDHRSAVAALQSGLDEAVKGTSKPELIVGLDSGFGFFVHVDDFTTIFVASNSNREQWAVISVRRADFNLVLNSLSVGG